MQLLPSILAAVAGVAAIFSPELQHFVALHPGIAGGVGAVYAIVSHLLPSPIAGNGGLPKR